MGNIANVQNAFAYLGYPAEVTQTPSGIHRAQALVLPGVGAYRDCMQALRHLELIPPLKQYLAANRPFLGICLGLQALFSGSEEFGSQEGLGVFSGRVIRFPAGLKVPHMGWNTLEIKRRPPLLDGLPREPYMYFVHSYYVVPEDSQIVAATTSYGTTFTSMIWHGNIFATQFHPEKSQKWGLEILKRFGQLSRSA